MFRTGVSSPTETACWASVARDETIGSLVKVIALKEADRTLGSRPLPSRVVSSLLAAASAPEGLLWILLLASIWPLSRPVTSDGCAARNFWVTTRFVVTNWPLGHRDASLTSMW